MYIQLLHQCIFHAAMIMTMVLRGFTRIRLLHFLNFWYVLVVVSRKDIYYWHHCSSISVPP